MFFFLFLFVCYSSYIANQLRRDYDKQDETALIAAHFGIQYKIGKEVFEARNTERPESVRAALDAAAWRGFCAGVEAAKAFYENE